MEHTSQLAMATLSEGESLRIDEELMARRLKNRERQRRYRAKKRLEADMRKSYMIQQQQAMWSVQPQLQATAVRSESSGPSAPMEAHSNSPATSFPTRIYSGRKWKKDARLARSSEASDSRSAATTLSQVDDNPECPASSTLRRDWKADARNKTGVVVCESFQYQEEEKDT